MSKGRNEPDEIEKWLLNEDTLEEVERIANGKE